MKKLIENRPWGNFVQFTKNEQTTVKILTINKGEELSLQYHNKRKEFWKVIYGNPQITIGEEKIIANVGDEFEIQEKVNHRIAAQNDKVEILEIAFGDFDENDIVRLEDRYGRS